MRKKDNDNYYNDEIDLLIIIQEIWKFINDFIINNKIPNFITNFDFS